MLSAQEITELIQTYLAWWSEPDEQVRWGIVERIWVDDGVYSDPTQHRQGWDALNKAVAVFQRARPNNKFVRTSGVDHHHDMLRFSWRWLAADGLPVLDGMDFAELSPDGRLQRITGFFGPFPDLE